jgi:hypothetical protein
MPSDHSPDTASSFDGRLGYAALFCTVLSAVLLSGHIAFRAHFGLTNDLLPVLKIFAFWLMVASAAFQPVVSVLMTSGALHALPLVVVLALMLPLLSMAVDGLLLFFLIALAGISGMFFMWRCTREYARKGWLALIFVPLVYGTCVLFWTNASETLYGPDGSIATLNALSFAPEIARQGVMYHDNYFNNALIFMLQRFDVPSTGLDGLVPFSHHLGGFYWFAGIGRLIGADPFVAVPLVQYGIIFPGVFYLLLLIVSCLRATMRSEPAFYVCFTVAAVAVFDAMLGFFHAYTSPTHGPALLLFLSGVPLLAILARRWSCDKAALFSSSVLLTLLAVGTLTIMTAFCKLHTGVFYAMLAGYVVLRRYLNYRALLVLYPAILIAAIIGCKRLFPDIALLEYEGLSFWQYLRSYLNWSYAPWYYMPAIFYWLWLGRKVVSGGAVHGLIYRELPVMAVVMATAAQFFPNGSNMVWFAAGLYWFMIALLCAHPNCEAVQLRERVSMWMRYARADRYTAVHLTVFCGVALFLLIIAIDIMSHGQKLVATWSKVSTLVSAYDRNAPSLLDRAATLAREASGGDARGFAVHVPPGNREFWSYGSRRLSRPFFIPSLAGLPMLMGLPPEVGRDCTYDCVLEGNSFGVYPADAVTHDTGPGALCARAAGLGLTRIYIMQDAWDPASNRLLDCDAGG